MTPMVVRRPPAPGNGCRNRRAPLARAPISSRRSSSRPSPQPSSKPGSRPGSKPVSRRIVRGFAGASFLAVLTLPGCNTSATTTLPTPDFRASAGAEFPLRAGELGLIVGAANYLFISVSSVGLDTRCPPAATCEDSGFLDLNLDLETRDNLGSLRLRIPPGGETVGTYGPFEIRSHRVQPDGRTALIPLTDYVVVLSATERETPPAGE